MKAHHIRYWGPQVTTRNNSTLADGAVFRGDLPSDRLLADFRAAFPGCAIHSCDEIDCDGSGPIYDSVAEYARLGSMTVAELQAIKDRRRCQRCHDRLTGHEDDSGTLCRWCVTCTPSDSDSADAVA